MLSMCIILIRDVASCEMTEEELLRRQRCFIELLPRVNVLIRENALPC